MNQSNNMSIYLDRSQCLDFEIEYYEDHSCNIPADAILNSKSYDKAHRDFLEPLGTSVLRLERVGYKGQALADGESPSWDSPGWYRVLNASLSG